MYQGGHYSLNSLNSLKTPWVRKVLLEIFEKQGVLGKTWILHEFFSLAKGWYFIFMNLCLLYVISLDNFYSVINQIR